MELEALAVGRHLGVVGVVHQAADAVVEHHGQVHTADLEGVGETAEHVRDRAAEVLLLLVAGDVGSAFRQDAVHDHAVAVGIVVEEVHPELVVTVGGVHAGVFRAPVVVAAPALAPFEHARVHLLLRQGGDDVAVVGGVEVHVPPEAVLVHDGPVEGEFHAVVLHVADVAVDAGETGGEGHRHGEQEVLRLTVEVFEGTGQAAEEGEVDTRVELQVGLPFEGLVRETGDHDTRIREVVVTGGVQALVAVPGRQVVVTHGAVAGLQLEVVDPGHTLQEILVVDTPGGAGGPEGTPAGDGRELGGAVGTDRAGEIVLVGKVIFHTAEEGQEPVVVHIGGGIVRLGGGTQLVQAAEREALAAGGEARHVAAEALLTQHHAHVVLSERLVERQDVRPRGGDVAVVGLLGVAAFTGGIAVLGAAVPVVLGDVVVDGDGALKGQAGEERDLAVVARGDLVHLRDVLVVGRIGQHIPAGPVRTVGTVLVDVVAIRVGGVAALRVVVLPDVECGRDRAEEPHDGVARRGIGQGVREGGVRAHFQPFLDLRGHIDTAGDTLELLGGEDSLVIEVAAGEIVVRIPLAPAQIDIVFLPGADLEHFAAPVAVPEEVVVGNQQIATGVHDVPGAPRVDLEFVGEVVRRERAGLFRGIAAVDGRAVQGLPGHPRILGGLELAGQRNGEGSETDIRPEGNPALLALALLRGDHDDAVRGAGAVQGGGGRILEDGHGLDVTRGDGVDVTRIGHPVHHVQRRARGVHGADTADVDGTAVTRLAAGVDDLDTRAEALEGLGDIGRRNLLDVLLLDDRRRSGEGSLGCRTVRHDDGLVEHLGVIHEDDVDDPPSVDGDGLFLIAQARDGEGPVRRDRNPERARRVAHGIHPGVAAEHDARADDRISCGILHRSPHFDVLCGRGQGGQQACQGSE